MGYQAALDHYITALPPSPFVDVAEIDDKRRFVLDENKFFAAIRATSDHWSMLDWPVWSPAEDPPPLFIGAPSDDFIEACHRDLMPLLERAARMA